jgi:hypothetical protein
VRLHTPKGQLCDLLYTPKGEAHEDKAAGCSAPSCRDPTFAPFGRMPLTMLHGFG